MTTIYDGEGNVIEISGGGGDIDVSAEVKQAFNEALVNGTIKIGGNIGSTLGIADGSLFNSTYMDTSYSNLLNAFKAHPNSIPFFIQSDEHGRGVEINRYANNIDTDGMEYLNINGGDTEVDVFSSSVLEEIYTRICYVKNFVGVAGNHDYKVGSEAVSEFNIRKTFCTTNLERRMITSSDLNCYVAYHSRHSVKVICIDPYDSRGIVSGMPHPYINSEVAEWVIKELSRNDGYDSIILIHEPQWKRTKTRGAESYTIMSASNGNTALYDLFVARRAKLSGTYTDSEGVSHSYDFANCEGDLLCELGGHWHEETYSDVDGFTAYAQDWAGDNKYGGTFGLIDRDNNLLRIFRFDNVNGAMTELDITLQ